MEQMQKEEIRKQVRDNYAKAAIAKVSSCGEASSSNCCSSSNGSAELASIALGYSDADVNAIPEGANMGLGCGNPQTIASLQRGETVLDLGSGGGFDCFLAANAVGDQGFVIGVDMTPEMVSKSRTNSVKTGYNHLDFRLGEIENLPVADNTVDVIISNCVINLSPEKEKVITEAFRVLKPGGRLAISDIVATATLPSKLKRDMSLLVACMAGASSIDALEILLQNAGFEQILIKPRDSSKQFIREWAPEHKIEDYVVSATIEAVKPQS